MAMNNSGIIDTTPKECALCNERVFKWIDMDTAQEFWATEFNRSTCGHSDTFHQVNEFSGDSETALLNLLDGKSANS